MSLTVASGWVVAVSVTRRPSSLVSSSRTRSRASHSEGRAPEEAETRTSVILNNGCLLPPVLDWRSDGVGPVSKSGVLLRWCASRRWGRVRSSTTAFSLWTSGSGAAVPGYWGVSGSSFLRSSDRILCRSCVFDFLLQFLFRLPFDCFSFYH